MDNDQYIQHPAADPKPVQEEQVPSGIPRNAGPAEPTQMQQINYIVSQTRSKVKRRYNWASLAIIIQMVAATSIVTVIEIMLLIAMRLGGHMTMSDFQAKALEYNMFLAGIAYVPVNVAVAFIVMKITKTGRITDYVRKPKISSLDVFLATVACIGISSVNTLIMTGFEHLTSPSDSDPGILDGIIESGLFSDNLLVTTGSILYIAILGPITEEILLRGCVLPCSSHISPRFGVIMSAILFGLMHGNISQIYNATFLGLLIGYVTVKSKSIIPGIIMHIANNTLSILETAYMQFFPEHAETVDILFSFAVAAAGVVCMIFLFNRLGRIQEQNDTLPINPPVPEEAVVITKMHGFRMTIGMLMSSWSFWVVAGMATVTSVMMLFL